MLLWSMLSLSPHSDGDATLVNAVLSPHSDGDATLVNAVFESSVVCMPLGQCCLESSQ